MTDLRKSDARIGLTILHLWRHPKIVDGCEVCRIISPKPKVKR